MFKLLSLVSILGTGSCQLYPTTGGINVKIMLNLLMFYWNCLFAVDRSMHKFLTWIDFIPRYMYFQNVCSCASLKANFLTLRRSFVACSIRQIAGEDLPPCCHQMTLTGPGINMPVFQTDPLFSSCLNDFYRELDTTLASGHIACGTTMHDTGDIGMYLEPDPVEF